MKKVYIEKWTTLPVKYGFLFEIDAEEFANVGMMKESLSILEGKDLAAYIEKEFKQQNIGPQDVQPCILGVEEVSQPVHEISVFADKEDALAGLNLDRFKEAAVYSENETGEKITWENKTKIISDLEKELGGE